MVATATTGARRTSRLRPPNVPNPAMGGIRGLAAMAVLIFHVGSQPSPATGKPLLNGLAAQWVSPLAIVAVGIFIGMSGFFLFHPMSLAHIEGRPHRPLDFYLARRMGRIFPPYWVILLLYVVFFGYSALSGWQWIPVLTLTHVYNPQTANLGVYVAWTLAVEVTFYLLLPVLAWGLRKIAPAETTTQRHRYRVQLVAVALVYLTGLACRTLVLLAGPEVLKYTKYMLFNFLDGFAGGMLFAVLLSWRKLGHPLPRVMEWLVRHPWVCLVFALELYWLGTTLGFPPGLELTGLPAGRLAIFAVSLLLIIPLLCLPGIFDEHGTSHYHRVFGSTALLWLGGISYGVYLINLPWTQKLASWQANGWVEFGPGTLGHTADAPPSGWFRINADYPQGFWPLLAGVALLTVVFAAASYMLIEKPLMRKVKVRFTSGATNPPVPAGAAPGAPTAATAPEPAAPTGAGAPEPMAPVPSAAGAVSGPTGEPGGRAAPEEPGAP